METELKNINNFAKRTEDKPYGVFSVTILSDSWNKSHRKVVVARHGKNYQGSNKHMRFGAVKAVRDRFFTRENLFGTSFEKFRDKVLRWSLSFWLKGQKFIDKECEKSE